MTPGVIDALWLSTSRLAVLAVPAALGALAGRARLFPDVDRAIGALNVFALYFGFPALVFAGVVDGRFALPGELGFWLLVPLTQAGLLLALRAALKTAGEPAQAGTMALTVLFGNVAYLGLPLVTALFGAAQSGAAALAVSIHVVLAVGLGPVLLRLWSGQERQVGALSSVVRQPLLWAPLVGLVARQLPAAARHVAETVAAPLAAAAAPVALFLLGLYLFARREAFFGAVPGATAHVVAKLLVAPACTWGVAALLVRAALLEPTHARIFVLLAAMPGAITTFSIAHAAGVGEERVAAVIVRSSLACIVTLPFVHALSMLG